MAKRILTLNIGTIAVELAEYEQRGKGELALSRYGITYLEAPLDFATAETILAPALLGLIRDTGIKPGPVALGVPGQSVFTKFAAVPMTGGTEKFEQMIRYEIEQGIPFPIDEMICDRQVIGDTENGDKSVMIVAAKTDQVEALTSAVSAVGFTPVLVDSAQGSLTNAVRYVHPESSESCVITLWIASKTTSLIITEGGKVYTRLIPIGGKAVTKEIAAACGCSMDEAETLRNEKGYVALGGVVEDEDSVADRVSKACRVVMTRINAEISRSVNFYRSQQQGSAPVKLYLTGGTALLPQIDAFFQDALGIEVEYFNPFDRIAVGPQVDRAALETDSAYLAATAGLAAQVAGEARFEINLLPPSLVAARASKAKIPFIAAGGAGLVLALVLVALGFGNETEVLEAQRDAVQQKVSKLEKLDKKVVAAQGELDAARAEAESLRQLLAKRAKSVQRVVAVRTSLNPGMWISAWEGDRITIRFWKDKAKSAAGGKTASETFVDKLKSKLVVDASSVKISDMSSVGTGGAVEQFTVEVKFK